MDQQTFTSEFDRDLQRNIEDELQVREFRARARRGSGRTRLWGCRASLGLGLVPNHLFLTFQIFHRLSPRDLLLWLTLLGCVIGRPLLHLRLTHWSPPLSGSAGA